MILFNRIGKKIFLCCEKNRFEYCNDDSVRVFIFLYAEGKNLCIRTDMYPEFGVHITYEVVLLLAFALYK